LGLRSWRGLPTARPRGALEPALGPSSGDEGPDRRALGRHVHGPRRLRGRRRAESVRLVLATRARCDERDTRTAAGGARRTGPGGNAEPALARGGDRQRAGDQGRTGLAGPRRQAAGDDRTGERIGWMMSGPSGWNADRSLY